MSESTHYCQNCDQTSTTYHNLVISVNDGTKYLARYCEGCDQEVTRRRYRL